MLEKEKVYEYPPTEEEAMRALRKQAWISLKFHIDPTTTVEEYAEKLEAAMAPIKRYIGTKTYSLEELAQKTGEDRRYRRLFEHESNHARQMTRVLRRTGMAETPRFTVYYCPIMADMYQAGNFIGLIEMNDIVQFTSRSKLIEFQERLAWEMAKSTDISTGDFYIIGEIMLAKIIGWFTRPPSAKI